MDKETKIVRGFNCKMLLELVIGIESKDKWMRIGFRYLLLDLRPCSLKFYKVLPNVVSTHSCH